MKHEQVEIREAVAQLLVDQSTLVLSTVDTDGTPRATPLFYLPGVNLELYWFSSGTSVHSRNIDRSSAASVALYAPTERWQEIRGAQLSGSAGRITDHKQRREVTNQYCQRFALGPMLRLAMLRSSLYSFRPTWIRYVDNSRGFGYKYEIWL